MFVCLKKRCPPQFIYCILHSILVSVSQRTQNDMPLVPALTHCTGYTTGMHISKDSQVLRNKQAMKRIIQS